MAGESSVGRSTLVLGYLILPHVQVQERDDSASGVQAGSMCLNHPELVHKHPTHLASSVMVWFV